MQQSELWIIVVISFFVGLGAGLTIWEKIGAAPLRRRVECLMEELRGARASEHDALKFGCQAHNELVLLGKRPPPQSTGGLA